MGHNKQAGTRRTEHKLTTMADNRKVFLEVTEILFEVLVTGQQRCRVLRNGHVPAWGEMIWDDWV